MGNVSFSQGNNGEKIVDFNHKTENVLVAGEAERALATLDEGTRAIVFTVKSRCKSP